MKKTIYIAGKVSGLPEAEVAEKFKRKHQELLALGHAVNNPVHIADYNCNPEDSWEEIMKVCINHLIWSDEIHLLPCWKESRGAILERNLARSLGIKIVYC